MSNFDVSSFLQSFDPILQDPGDKLDAKITKTRRKVVRVTKANGTGKFSVTEYPNGTIVETKSVKLNKPKKPSIVIVIDQ